MKNLFVILLSVGIFLTVCDAACFFQKPQFRRKPLNGCLGNDNEVHALSSEWVTKDCLRCDCYSDGSMSCCTMLDLPMAIQGDECEVLEDRETCTTKMVYKNDHTKECM